MPKLTSKYENFNLPIIELTDNKLIVTNSVLKSLNVLFGDRVSINYYQISRESTFPVIAKSDVFFDPDAGQKLTKSNTISFKGIQNTMLSKYGSLFLLESFKNNMFKMIPVTDDELNHLNY